MSKRSELMDREEKRGEEQSKEEKRGRATETTNGEKRRGTKKRKDRDTNSEVV